MTSDISETAKSRFSYAVCRSNPPGMWNIHRRCLTTRSRRQNFVYLTFTFKMSDVNGSVSLMQFVTIFYGAFLSGHSVLDCVGHCSTNRGHLCDTTSKGYDGLGLCCEWSKISMSDCFCGLVSYSDRTRNDGFEYALASRSLSQRPRTCLLYTSDAADE